VSVSLSLSHPPSPVPDTFYVLHELLSSVHLPPYHISHTLPAHPPTQRGLTHSPSARRRQRAQQGASRSSADHQQGASAARAVQHLSSCIQSILPYFFSMLYVYCFTVWAFSECNEYSNDLLYLAKCAVFSRAHYMRSTMQCTVVVMWQEGSILLLWIMLHICKLFHLLFTKNSMQYIVKHHSMQSTLKGIVHPNIKITVIIYSPSCHSKPVWLSFFCWTQNKIFWRILVTKHFLFSLNKNLNFGNQFRFPLTSIVQEFW